MRSQYLQAEEVALIRTDRSSIQPGTDALFAVVRKVTADKVLEGLNGSGGTAALAGAQAAVPASTAVKS